MEVAMDGTSPEFPDWANGLPLDMLLCVRDLLGFPDSIRLRAVCRPWRTSLRRLSLPSPWVVIPGSDDDGWDKFTLVSLPENSFIKWKVLGSRCVGSSKGWLAILDGNLQITLVNPLMATPDVRARAVHLPPLWRAANGTVAADRFGLTEKTDRVRMPTMQRHYIEKMAFSPDPSSGDYAVAVLCRCGHGVAFTNSGRGGWEWLEDWPIVWGEPHPPHPTPEDELDGRHVSINPDLDVVYHRGRFYYMTACGRIWALDATAPAGTPVEPVLFAVSQLPREQLLRYGKHMVFTEDGTLHVVWSDLNGMPIKEGSSTVKQWEPMRVQRYEPGNPSGWRDVQHLGGRSFLIGSRSQSVCLEEPARKKTWLSPNCIYFTNIMPGSTWEHTEKHPHIIEFNVVTRVFSTRNHFGHDLGQPNVDYPWKHHINLPDGEPPGWDWTKAIWFTPLA